MTTQSTNYATEIFYVAEITSFRSGNSAITFEYGYGTVPHGTLAQFSDGPVSANSITYASDVGYRTPASDGDPVVYPPLMTQEFQIDRKIVLPPASAGISAAWGTLSLRNDGNQFSSLVQYNNNDGRNINIYYGTKNYENYIGLKSNVAARNIYIDPHYSSLNPIFKGLQSPWQLNELTLDIPLRDASYWLLRPLQQNLYSGSGSYNGTSTLASLPIPMTRGGTSTNPVKNVTPTLIDPPNLIYQYNDAAGTIVALYEGAAITYAFSSDTTNLYVGSTTAGHYRTDNSRGLFQLGSTPTGQITCDVTGKFPTAGAQSNAITIAQYLLSETLSMPSQYINTANFSAQNALYPYTSGFYYSSNDTPTGIDALNQILFGMGAKLYPARDGTLKVLVLRAPSGNSVATFDTTNTISVSTTPLDAAVDPPTYRVRVGYNHNYTVQTTGIIANATATQRAYVSTTDSLTGATSSAVQTNYKRPNDLPAVTGSILSNTAANAIAFDLIRLWGTRRRTYLVTVPISIGLLRDLGDIITLICVMDDLSNGKLGIIVGESFSGVDSTITFTILV